MLRGLNVTNSKGFLFQTNYQFLVKSEATVGKADMDSKT